MRCVRLSVSVAVAFALLGGSAWANMPYGYPRLDDRALAGFWIAVSAGKTVYLTWRYKTGISPTAILMLVSTFLWLYSLFTIAMFFFSDISSLVSLFQLLGLEFGLGILIDWPFVHAALNRLRNSADPSFKAAAVMQAAVCAVLLGIFLLCPHTLPLIPEDYGGGGD